MNAPSECGENTTQEAAEPDFLDGLFTQAHQIIEDKKRKPLSSISKVKPLSKGAKRKAHKRGRAIAITGPNSNSTYRPELEPRASDPYPEYLWKVIRYEIVQEMETCTFCKSCHFSISGVYVRKSLESLHATKMMRMLTGQMMIDGIPKHTKVEHTEVSICAACADVQGFVLGRPEDYKQQDQTESAK